VVAEFDEIVIEGEDNMLFIGDFPELKLCEGSSNNVASGSTACCIIVGQYPALQNNCIRSNPHRRQLSQCPVGSFNVGNACDEHGVYCHKHKVVNGCADCALCTESTFCPTCLISDRRLLAAPAVIDGNQRLAPGSPLHHNIRPIDNQPLTNVKCDDSSDAIRCENPGDQYDSWCCGGSDPSVNFFCSSNADYAAGKGGRLCPNAFGIVRIAQMESCAHEPCHKKLTVHGSRNLVFIGHFPKLKMCEGSGNQNAGQANCCVLFAQKTKTQVQQCSATRRRALKEFDGDCPSGTFNIRHTCEELGEWCHDIDGALGGCMDCRQCNSYDTCPSCAPYYRKN